jgi:hypothetical protein
MDNGKGDAQMSTYPRTAWTFGTKSCQVRKVTLIEHSRFGQGELDAKGGCYFPRELYATEREALAGVKKYLDRKQAEIDELQSNVDRRRNFLRQQLRVCT